MNKRKFTLMELLVVIAVIGILLSLLLPSLMKAREQAKLAVCLSNQKQINIACNSYSQSSNGLIVPRILYQENGISWWGQYTWTRLLHDGEFLVVDDPLFAWGHLESESRTSVYYCPALNYSQHHPWGSIGMNKNVSGDDPKNKHQPENFSKYIEVDRPSSVVLTGDSFKANGNGAWHLNSPSFITQGSSLLSGSPYPLSSRHLYKSASSFVDGHGAILRPVKILQDRESLYTGPLANP